MTINLSTFLGTTFQGNTGTQGAQGVQGQLGAQGLSNQGVQGQLGAQGSQGVQGQLGAQGSQGVQGRLGAQGSQGLQGTLGAQGSQGVQGLSNQGVQGSQGLQGTLGAQGSQGVQGLSNQGVQGSQGLQGPVLVGIPSSTNTTISASDAGKHLNINANVTIASTSGFSIGDMCTIYNNGTTIRTIIAGAGTTLRFAGTASTGNRSLSQRGLANILCVGASDYVISGAGLT